MSLSGTIVGTFCEAKAAAKLWCSNAYYHLNLRSPSRVFVIDVVVIHCGDFLLLIQKVLI